MSFGGDPNVGIKLGNMLQQAGFQGICTKPLFFLLDNTVPQQKSEWLTYFYNLFQSALPGLMEQKQSSAEELALVKKELEVLKEREDAILSLATIQAKGFVPE
jgi:hypothetical protein